MGNNRRDKLDRYAGVEFTVKSQRGDQVQLWSPSYMAHTNLSLTDERGENVVTIYGLQDEQLAALYAAIGQRLGLPSSVTLEHLRQLQRHLREVFPEPTPMPFDPGEQQPLVTSGDVDQPEPASSSRPDA